MNLNFRAMAALCSVAVSFSSGCESSADSSSGGVSPLFTEGSGGSVIRPYEPTEEDSLPAELADCTIELAADSVKISGEGAQISGGSVTINDGGTYRLSGSGSQRIVLESSEAVALILDSVEIITATGAPIENAGGASLMLTLAANSENLLNAEGYAGVNSDGDITVNGTGSLFVSAQEGILSDGAVKLCGGALELDTEKRGISCGGYVLCAGADVDISSGADGISAEHGYINIVSGGVDITSDGSGMSALEAVFVSGGETTLRCGGGSSAVMLIESGGKYPYGKHGGFYTNGAEEFDFSAFVSGDGTAPAEKKGISCGGEVNISGGGITIDSADDSISARGDILVDGGTLAISSGDDALHAGGSITVSSGCVEVRRSYTALESLAVDISGGELRLTSFRDGIKSAGGNDMAFYSSENDGSGHYVCISGGSVVIDAGGDGIDTGGTAAINGGEVTVFSASAKQFGSLRYDDSFALSGGTLAAFGSAGQTKAPSMVAGVCLSLAAELPEGAQVKLTDDSGNELYSVALPKACETVVFSSERLIEGVTYHLLADGAEINSVTASQGVCGDGPSGRGGAFDNLHNGEQNAGEIA